MYKVTAKFRDKYNPSKVYQIGEAFDSKDKARIDDLIKRGLIKEEKDAEKPEKEKGKGKGKAPADADGEGDKDA